MTFPSKSSTTGWIRKLEESVSSSKNMAPQNSTKKSERPAVAIHSADLDLDLPDWSGMDDSAARITPEAAFKLCKHYPLLASSVPPEKRDNNFGGGTAEFVL